MEERERDPFLSLMQNVDMIDGPSSCTNKFRILVPTRRRRRRRRGKDARGGEGGTICRRNTSVDSLPLHRAVPLHELDDFTIARHVVVSSSPSNPGFSASSPLSQPSLVIFLSSSPYSQGEGARHCLQAPVCTYIYNNVTHTPRPRLFLLFRVAARGSSHGSWFDCLVSTIGRTCKIGTINGR